MTRLDSELGPVRAAGSPGSESAGPAAHTGGPVQLSVNGTHRTVPSGTTLDRVVAELSSAPSGVAAAVNETVVPRAQWAASLVRDGDRVEVLTAVQGG